MSEVAPLYKPTVEPPHKPSSDLNHALAQALIEVPPAVLDLARFLAATWAEIDVWAFKEASPSAMTSYPVIQGTRFQAKLRLLGSQPHDTTHIGKAVDWLLAEMINRRGY